MAASDYNNYNRRSSVSRNSDTLSPLWPDRAIRPLPKNRLRSKLSPEQADSIVYPPNPPSSPPVFNFPYGLNDANEERRMRNHHHTGVPTCTCGVEHDDSEEEEEEYEERVYDHPDYRWSSPGAESRLDSVQRKLISASANGHLKGPPPPASVASSADGYESFENTNNKKKRKIPLSSSSNFHQSQLSAELANIHISNGETVARSMEPPNGHPHLQQSFPSSTGKGVSGPGRGRYSNRPIDPRRSYPRPVPTSQQTLLNGYSSSLSAKSRGGDYRGDGTKTSTGHTQDTTLNSVLTSSPGQNGENGIISTAIANAQDPATPPRGKENESLLSQSSPQTNTPKTQFTFTCESDSSSKIGWSNQEPGIYGTPTSAAQHPIPHTIRSSSDPTGRAMPQPNASTAVSQQQRVQRGIAAVERTLAQPGPPPAPNAPLPPNANGAPPPPAKPRRRRPSREFRDAARERKAQQQFTNYHHKPRKEDMWICEFCEYEDIYGVPPLALIRQYEIKDRDERKKAEERRRLLEKAKMRKGKGKKAGKNGKNGGGNGQGATNAGVGGQAAANASHQNAQGHNANHQGQYDQDGLDHVPLPPEGHPEEYYDDEEEEEDDIDGHGHQRAYDPLWDAEHAEDDGRVRPEDLYGRDGRAPPPLAPEDSISLEDLREFAGKRPDELRRLVRRATGREN